LKILHSLKHCVEGNGGVHVAVDLACAQADAGHDVAFVSGPGSYEAVLTDHGVRVVTLADPASRRGIVRHAAGLLAATRRERPDVMHAHMMSSAVLGAGIARLVGAPMITTVHNSFDKHSALMRLGSVVVAVSDAERRLLLSRGFPAGKVVTVLNGTDGSAREALHGEYLGPLRRPCVMTLSGLHPRKAVHDTITAFSLVAADFPDWHLNIVGWGPDRDRLESMVAELGLVHAVHFLGSTLTPRPLLEEADVFATATLAEPFSLSVAEARSAGCAIVATSVGGIPEVLDGGRAGTLVPPGDPAAMAEAFRTIMGDEAALRDAQARARAGAGHLTVRRMAEDYLQVYAAASGADAVAAR
jgi:glycosyltransferase involved in cell wall biosynthesis